MFLFIIPFFSSCRPDSADEPSVIVTVQPEFLIDPYEQRDLNSGEATLGIWVESLQVYDCSGYQIDAQVNKSGQQIDIELLAVTRPANCSGSPAPARQFVPIGQLSAGTYPLRLTLGKTIVNEGTLTVESDHFSLAFAQARGFEIQNYTAYYLPEALVWGYVSITNEATNTAAQTFISDLKTITSDHGLAPGFYSYFTLSGTGEIFFHSSVAEIGARTTFVRRLSASQAALKSLLQNYRSGIPGQQEPLMVRCFSTFGEF